MKSIYIINNIHTIFSFPTLHPTPCRRTTQSRSSASESCWKLEIVFCGLQRLPDTAKGEPVLDSFKEEARTPNPLWGTSCNAGQTYRREKTNVANRPAPHPEHRSREDSEYCPAGHYFKQNPGRARRACRRDRWRNITGRLESDFRAQHSF
jgi:hypothetical protein